MLYTHRITYIQSKSVNEDMYSIKKGLASSAIVDSGVHGPFSSDYYSVHNFRLKIVSDS